MDFPCDYETRDSASIIRHEVATTQELLRREIPARISVIARRIVPLLLVPTAGNMRSLFTGGK